MLAGLARPLGYACYVAVMGAGYYYNLTFVQLGLIDLGTRVVGLPRQDVSVVMGGFALGAFAVAVLTGRSMDQAGWGADLRAKLKVLVAVVGGQTLLTVLAPAVDAPAAFVAWVTGCSLTIGVGMPVTFSLMADFVPVRHRGGVAATVAAVAFAAAAVFPLEWRIEEFAPVMTVLMVPAVAVMAWLAFRPTALVSAWARQHARFGPGRFRRDGDVDTTPFWLLVALMFAVFFIDSLGFVRIIEAPAYISTSWQSVDVGVRVFIAAVHVAGAAMAGVLYTALGRRWLLAAIFGLFAFTHLLYTFHLRAGPAGIDPPLALPLFYVLAVSFYTTLNFALWPDLATPETIGTRTAFGVGVAGWLASFLSTAAALWSEGAGLSLAEHLTWVNALALLLAAGYPVLWYVRRARALLRAT